MTERMGPDALLLSENERLKAEVQRLRDMLASEQTCEARFNLLIENSHEWIWEVDENGVYTYASPQVKEVFGYEPEELIGKTPFDIMPADEAARVGAIFGDIAKQTKPFSKLANRCIHKEGHILDIETSGAPIFNEKGHFKGYRGIDHDRSAEKRYEQELQKRSDELERKNRLLTNLIHSKSDLQLENKQLELRIEEEVRRNTEQEQLTFHQNKLLQMGEMVSMIAHQWRQPLAALSARASHLYLSAEMGSSTKESIKESSLFIEQQCQKMSKTIDTFLNFARPVEEESHFQLRDMVENVIQIMDAQLKYQHIALDVREETYGVSMDGLEGLIEQVLINLLSNSKDAFESYESDHKGITITIKGSPEKMIVVEDNAGGIPESAREKIFNPYFTTKEAGKGTGIGLYMGQDIMRKHFNGELRFIPLEGGSRFELIIRK